MEHFKDVTSYELRVKKPFQVTGYELQVKEINTLRVAGYMLLKRGLVKGCRV